MTTISSGSDPIVLDNYPSMHTPCRAPRQLCSLADWRKNFFLSAGDDVTYWTPRVSFCYYFYVSYQQTIQKKWFCSYKICDMKFVMWHESCQVNKLRQVQKMHILDKNAILWIELGFVSFLIKISYFHAVALWWKILKLKMIALLFFSHHQHDLLKLSVL